MYKVRTMISIFQGWPRKIPGSYTLGQNSLYVSTQSVYIMHTAWKRRYTGRSVEGVYTEFYGCGRISSMTVHIVVHISVYIMYTVWNRRYTGRYVEGVYTEFYSCGKVPSSSGHMSVYSMYTGRIKGYTECGVEGMFTDFHILWIMSPPTQDKSKND